MDTLIKVLLVGGAVAWVLVAIAVAVALGVTIADADADRHQPKPCCPHRPEEAPETVRGEFRAVVVPAPEQRAARLDVRA